MDGQVKLQWNQRMFASKRSRNKTIWANMTFEKTHSLGGGKKQKIYTCNICSHVAPFENIRKHIVNVHFNDFMDNTYLQ